MIGKRLLRFTQDVMALSSLFFVISFTCYLKNVKRFETGNLYKFQEANPALCECRKMGIIWGLSMFRTENFSLGVKVLPEND